MFNCLFKPIVLINLGKFDEIWLKALYGFTTVNSILILILK